MTGTATKGSEEIRAHGDPLFKLERSGDRFVFYAGTPVGPATFSVTPESLSAPELVSQSWLFLPSATSGRVWLAFLDESSPETERALARLDEVSIDGATVHASVEPPAGRTPVGVVSKGLLFQADDRLELWDPASAAFVDELPGEFPVAAQGRLAASCALPCDALTTTDLATGARRTVATPLAGYVFSAYEGEFSANGDYLAVPLTMRSTSDGRDIAPARLAVIEVLTGDVALPQRELKGVRHHLAWSQEDDWLYAEVGEGQLGVYHRSTNDLVVVSSELPESIFGFAAR